VVREQVRPKAGVRAVLPAALGGAWPAGGVLQLGASCTCGQGAGETTTLGSGSR